MDNQKPKTPEPPKNPTPKQRFQQNTRLLKDYVTLIDADAFQQSLDLAMLEYQQSLTQETKDAMTASAAGFKLKGALEFMRVLKTMADTHVVTARRDLDNLEEFKR